MLNEIGALYAVSGKEDEMRDFLIKNLSGCCDTLKTDGMGSVIATKKGDNPELKLFLLVPMDESGIIISQITEDGYLKFHTIGKIRPEFLVSKRVLIHGHSGVIAVKAVHLATKAEREKPVCEEDLWIDIGAESKEDAEAIVTIGDYGSFDSTFLPFGDAMIKGRALGSKISCALALELLKLNLPITLEVAFVAQFEIGFRGATTALRQLTAKHGIILDGIAEGEDASCNQGPVFFFHLLEKENMDEMQALAKTKKIPLQIRFLEENGRDLIVAKDGTEKRFLGLGIPVRYQESAAQVASLRDKNMLFDLLLQFINDYANGGFFYGDQ